MKRIGFVFLLLIFQLSSYSQDYHVVDSIKRLLQNEHIQDTNTVMRYLYLGGEYVWSVPDTAIYYDNKALSLSRQLHYTNGEFFALVSRAYTLAVVREDSTAVASAYQAIAMAETLKNKQLITNAYFTLGTVYTHLKEFDKGILYHRKALSYFDGSYPYFFQAYDEHLAQCYLGLNRTDSAFYYVNKALADDKQIQYNNGFDLYLMGNVFLQRALPDSALKYYRDGLTMVTAQHVLKNIADCNLGIANAFLQKNRFDSAIHYAKEGWIVANKTRLPNEKLDALNLLTSLFASQKKIDSAYKYQQYATLLKDSIYNAAKVRQVQLLAFNDDLRKLQDAEVARKRLNTNIIFALVALLLFAFIIVAIIYNNNKKRKKAYTLLQQQKEEIDNKNKELEIESALERVRSRSMGMQKSEELREVIQLVLDQLLGLDFPIDAASFTVEFNESNDLKMWLAAPGQQYAAQIDIPYIDHPIFRRVAEAKKNGENFFTLINTKEEKNRFLDHFFKYAPVPEERKKVLYSSAGLTQSAVLMKTVALTIYNYSAIPYSEEQNKTIVRFGNAFEQVYTRFLDLQKAEAQTREAQIETALERVRSRTMAMQKSEELIEVVAIVIQKLRDLGFMIDNSGIVILVFTEGSKDVIHWAISPDVTSSAISLSLPYFDHPINIDLFNAKENRISFFAKVYSHEEKNSFYKYAYEHSDYQYLPDEIKNWLLEREKFALSFALEKNSAIIFFNYTGKLLSENENQILKRFSGVFEQTYTRFLDLQRAEVQAREAQIEAALERVRSRSMGMQKSEELREVIQLILDQLLTLHFSIDSASFAVELNEGNDFKMWLAAPGQQYAARIDVPYLDHPMFRRYVEAMKNGETFYTVLLTKEEKDRFYDHFLNYAPVTAERSKWVYSSAGWAQSTVLMKTVALNIQNYSGNPYSEEENKTLVRFGKAFEQTYTRFLDLQKAEAAAKEAVKQASIDRVRAEIASMRNTKDLDSIIPLIWNELTILHIPFLRCGVFIINEAAQQTQVYLSTPEGKAIAAFQLPFDSKGLNEEMLQHWRKNQIFKDHWDAAAFSAWTHSLLEAGAIQRDERYSNEQPPENLYLHFVPFLQGMLYVGNTAPLSADELNLIESLADAFSTAYARYEDFSKLEAAKQQIETTLTELKSTQAQLIQAEKMASLGELTAGIAHEIQNPLNFVNNFSEVSTELVEELKGERSKRNGERDEELEIEIMNDLTENLQKINHHGKRADSIVKGMLEHSRAAKGEKQLTDINALAEEYLRLAYHGLRAKDKSFNTDFNTSFDASIGKINIVPQDIGRVLLNLFNNAFYAVNEKKKQLRAFEPLVSVTTAKRNGSIILTVSDNGSGIPQNIINKIFQPFFTTKPTGQGTGLGLSLSYDIIKAHGGQLKVETNEGKGAEFIIQLPVV